MEKSPLAPDFVEFLRLLDARNVDYLLIGGYAVGFHGHVRGTADLDIWIRPELQNAGKIVTVLKEFGFDLPEIKPQIFLLKSRVVRLGEPPVQIEIFSSILGVDFDECFSNRVISRWDKITVSVIGREDLILAKRASGRQLDLNDIEKLGGLE
ncbi:MAG: hypothetical protein IIA50_03445 [Bacteroidetes bacterium]|nr:hypothetical protein [Bacteroidota bacterium]